MKPYDAYCLYLGLRMHFTNDGYDWFKYNGKVKANPDSYLKRSDKIFFEKLAKHQDLRGFLVSNLSQNATQYVRTLAYSEEAKKTYEDWSKRIQSLTYHVSNELGKLDDVLAKNLAVSGGQHPLLLKMLMRGEISIETVCVLSDIINFIPYWDEKLADDIVYQDLRNKIMKYKPFVSFDRDKLKNILRKRFNMEKVA